MVLCEFHGRSSLAIEMVVWEGVGTRGCCVPGRAHSSGNRTWLQVGLWRRSAGETTRRLGRSKPQVGIRNKRLEEAEDAASQREIYEASRRVRRAKTESASFELV